MTEIFNLRAYNYPLGGEINLQWDLSEELTPQDVIILFKSTRQITTEEIQAYFTSGTKAADVEAYKLGENYRTRHWDYDIEYGVTYYYGLVINRLIVENNSQRTEQSLPALADVKAERQEIIIKVVPDKEIVIAGIKKMLKVIADNNPDIDLEVAGKYPLLTEGTKGISVTRATSETAYKFWGNQSDSHRELISRGNVEASTINVTWWVLNNSDLRDKITDIFRGTNFLLPRYFKRQFKDIKVQVGISMMGDNEEYKQGSYHVFYGSMLINFLFENSVTMKKSPLLEAISLELGFSEDNSIAA